MLLFGGKLLQMEIVFLNLLEDVMKITIWPNKKFEILSRSSILYFTDIEIHSDTKDARRYDFQIVNTDMK